MDTEEIFSETTDIQLGRSEEATKEVGRKKRLKKLGEEAAEEVGLKNRGAERRTMK